jgi:hypothetical protein
MKQRFLIGTDLFSKHRLANAYFVDKSLLISDILNGSEVTLLPRPRRFGKTLGMTMMKAFFEQNEPGNRALFSGLKIENDNEAMKHFGKYPTIYMSLKDIRAGDWQTAKAMLVTKMSTLIKEHLPQLHGCLDSETEKVLDELQHKRAQNSDLLGSLRTLVTALYEATGQPVVLLIDEYDTPVIEARVNGYQQEMLDFFKSWLGSALKPEKGEILFRAVLTGILRIARESLFSELNNFRVHSMINAGPFADKFGFTEDEVQKILSDFGQQKNAEEIKRWYNGYNIGDLTIYNPWSVTSYIADYPLPARPHWLNTSSNRLIHEELAKGGMELKRELQTLLRGEELRYEINENTVLDDVGKNTTNIWSFLYFCGYLKAQDPKYSPINPNRLEYSLSIPNAEVSLAYEDFVRREFDTLLPDAGLEAFQICFTQPAAHLQHLETTLQRLVLQLVSFHDTARQPEAVFHAFCLGLLANLRMIYDIRSNHEVGYGRADITMEPKTDRFPTGFVIEFKSIAENDDIEQALNQALEQIKSKAYDTQLEHAGVAPIYRIAIVLQGKKLRVKF